MRAVAVLPAERQVRVIDHPEPKIESGTQAKIKMLNVGICGTDKEIVSFEYGTPPDGSDYLVIGHESLGEQDFCYTGDFTERGIKQRHGYMTDLVVEEERYLNRVPAELREVAVLVEPLTIAEKALEQLLEIQKRLPWWMPPQNVVVLGAGPVGLLGAMALTVAGFNVTVYSRTQSHEDKDTIVAAIGAKFIPAETHTVEQMATAAGRIDVVYEAIGASGLAFEVVKHLGPNAVFIFTGVPGRKGPLGYGLHHARYGSQQPANLWNGERPARKFCGRHQRHRNLHEALARRAQAHHHRPLPHRRRTPAALRQSSWHKKHHHNK